MIGENKRRARRPLPDQATLLKLLTYDPDTGLLTWRPRTPDMFNEDARNGRVGRCNMWNGKFAGTRALYALGEGGYRTGTLCGETCVRASRVIWKMMTGEDPEHVAHLNDDLNDLRWENLANVDRKTVSRSTKVHRSNRSGRIGVCWDSNKEKWVAQIGKDGRPLQLGKFKRKADAVRARESAEQKLGYPPNHVREAKSGRTENNWRLRRLRAET